MLDGPLVKRSLCKSEQESELRRLFLSLFSVAYLCFSTCCCNDRAAKPKTLDSGESATQGANLLGKWKLVLTDGKKILLQCPDQESDSITFMASRPIRFAVPLNHELSCFIVTVPITDGAIKRTYEMSVLDTTRGTELMKHRYRDIGLPTVSPCGLKTAWVAKETTNGACNLYLAATSDLRPTRTLKGPFCVDAVGPSWRECESGVELIVGLTTGQIAVVNLDSGKIDVLCQGETPCYIPGRREVLYFIGSELFVYRFETKRSEQLKELGYIFRWYRSMRVTQDGNLVVCSTLAMPSSRRIGPAKEQYTIVSFDRTTGQVRTVSEGSPEGPWSIFE